MSIFLLLLFVYNPEDNSAKMYVRPAYNEQSCNEMAKESERYMYQNVPGIRQRRLLYFCKPASEFADVAAEIAGTNGQ